MKIIRGFKCDTCKSEFSRQVIDGVTITKCKCGERARIVISTQHPFYREGLK